MIGCLYSIEYISESEKEDKNATDTSSSALDRNLRTEKTALSGAHLHPPKEDLEVICTKDLQVICTKFLTVHKLEYILKDVLQYFLSDNIIVEMLLCTNLQARQACFTIELCTKGNIFGFCCGFASRRSGKNIGIWIHNEYS